MNWRRLCLRFTMIVVALGIAWMHSSAHAHDADDCHAAVSAPHAAVAEPMSALTVDDRSDTTASAAESCMALLAAICVAVLTFLFCYSPEQTTVLESIARPHGAVSKRVAAAPPGLRWSFLELSVWRI